MPRHLTMKTLLVTLAMPSKTKDAGSKKYWVAGSRPAKGGVVWK